MDIETAASTRFLIILSVISHRRASVIVIENAALNGYFIHSLLVISVARLPVLVHCTRN